MGNSCIIKDGAWVGFGSVVISSTIGENSVVGVNSTIINMDIPENSLLYRGSRLHYKIRK